MAAAALVISMMALIVAGLSAWFARSQARAQTEATNIERERRLDERAPDFGAEIEDVNSDGGFYRLWITLTTAETLDGISVELPPTCSFVFATNISGVSDERHAHSYEGEIEHGARACWRVEPRSFDISRGETILIRSRRGADKWTRQLTTDPPTRAFDRF